MTTLFLISLLTFLIFQLLPGDPLLAILGPDADAAQIDAMKEKLGLDQSLLQRYFKWIWGAFHGDLGISYQYDMAVSRLIRGSFFVTAGLAVITLLFTFVIGFSTALFLAQIIKSRAFNFLSTINQIWFSIPSFCTAILLILLFSVKLGLFPTMGYVSPSQGFFLFLRSMALPALSLALGSGSILSRYITSSIKSQLKQDYVRTARSKGLSEKKVIINHVLRNALIPSLTIFGLIMTEILGGSIIVENVFSLPGIGRLIATSIQSRDFPLIQGLVLYLAFITLSCNFLVDMLYRVVDPRIRLQGEV